MSFAYKSTIVLAAWQIAASIGAVAPAQAENFNDPVVEEALTDKAAISFAKGHKALDEKNPQAAEAFYRKAVELNPGEPRYHRQLAIILTKLNKGQQAERECLIAQSLDPEDWRTKLVLGTIYHLERRFDEEVEVYRKVLTLLPEDQKVMKEKLTAFIEKDEASERRRKEFAARKKEQDEKQYKNVY